MNCNCKVAIKIPVKTAEGHVKIKADSNTLPENTLAHQARLFICIIIAFIR